MWSFLIAIMLCIALIVFVCWMCCETEENAPAPSIDECSGENHGPTSLGGVMHTTCLKRVDGVLEMWCHTHNQEWSDCITQYQTS